MAAILDVLNCTINRSKSMDPYCSSGTSGGTKTIDGEQDVTIDMECNAQAQVVPAALAGTAGTLTITQQAANGIHTGPVLCSRLRVNIPVEGGGRITHTFEFGCNGAWAADMTPGLGAVPYTSANATFALV